MVTHIFFLEKKMSKKRKRGLIYFEKAVYSDNFIYKSYNTTASCLKIFCKKVGNMVIFFFHSHDHSK